MNDLEETFGARDLIKKSMLKLDSFTAISYVDLFWTLLISLFIGLFIYYIYKKSFRGVVYSHSYNITFVIMTMITSLIIITISTNIVLSLGMVGALSIVRFRTAVKDPVDIMFMYWSIFAGIAAGAGMLPVAILGSIIVGITILLLSRKKIKNATYLLVIHFTDEAYDAVKVQVTKLKGVLRSKTVRKGITEMTVEIKLKTDNTFFVNELSELPGIHDVSLVNYNGDYAP
ncbi:DUF4956 domain-containing protein [Paenibacillus sp. TAF58]|uniref:DUF4956 domain-containing protein n=1 Tax=unclassified Paenibacillus TaxID=185978 RepID=UPI000709C209|nr:MULTISPECIES: DUF4956 domain-containing protein [unclassified Paenibacillus]KQX66372.1 hypothetical protein ASD40_28185 [Paenibacillus sp. Root444D2]KRE40955.1 hypothetical protein ASG85_34330 [Paenibacillus sp. Soil724D2]